MTHVDFLHAEKILEMEFERARAIAENAEKDITAILNSFFLGGGTSSLAVVLLQSVVSVGSNKSLSIFDIPRSVFSLLFAILGFVGFFTLMRVVLLRQMWDESMNAMSIIKTFYIARYPDLDGAFLGKPKTTPTPGMLQKIAFNLSLFIALFDSAAIAAAFHFADQYLANADMVGVFAATLFFLWQLWFYFFQLPLNGK